METEHQPYFSFVCDAIHYYQERVRLASFDTPQRLQRLKDGEPITSVIPELEKQLSAHWQIASGRFVTREEGTQNGTRFYSANGFTNVGPLLVPSRLVKTREEWLDEMDNTYWTNYSGMLETIERFPEQEVFHYEGGKLNPFDEETMLCLDNLDRPGK